MEAIIALANYFVRTRQAPILIKQQSLPILDYLSQFQCKDVEDAEDWRKLLLRWRNSEFTSAYWEPNNNNSTKATLYFKYGTEKEKKMLARKYDDMDAQVANKMIDDIEEIIYLRKNETVLYFIETEDGKKIIYYFTEVDELTANLQQLNVN